MSDSARAEISEVEKKRQRWRSRRGLLELDLVITRFLAQHYDALTPDQFAAYVELLDWPDNDLLDLRCLNIKPEIMSQFMQELTGSEEVPLFASPVLRGDELSGSLLRELHQMIMQEREDLAKEETFYFLLEQLVAAGISKTSIEAKAPPVRRVTEHLLGHYTEKVTLEELAAVACMNKYSLLRLFTKTEGITPYRYLETIRIGKAKELLAQDLEPAEVALMTGFSDQSHFSKFFKEVIGLTPGQYRNIFKVKQ